MKHETRSTVEMTRWCNACRRVTRHRVDDRRPGPCLEHEGQGMTKKQAAAAKKREAEQRQPKLF